MSESVRTRSFRRIGRCAVLAGLAAVAVMAWAPSSASAACPEPSAPLTFSTSWIGGSGSYGTDANWSNGAPTALCDASITAAGTYTVAMTGGSNAKSMTIGGAGSTPTLEIRAEGANTNLNVQAGGFLNIASGASLTMRCNPSPACGAPNLGAPTISNAGTLTVESSVIGQPGISGALANTGVMNFNHTAKFNNGAVTNFGTVNIADATVLASGGSSCGDTGVSFKNDIGGSINATGTGTFDVINYEQGGGTTTGTSTNPVQMPCGSLKYTGSGASSVRAYGGFTLTGTIQNGQALTVSAEGAPNVNAILGGNFTNNGSITLTSSLACGPTCGAGFNVNDKDFVNAGTFTVAAASGTGASVGANHEGTITNTGTMQFDQSAPLGGPVTNQGAINIADTKVVTSSGSSCGDTGASVNNDTGGTINATGSGTLSVINYEQGAGTTTGTTPVQIPCGTVKYTGNGASKVQANGGFTLTGAMQSGQSLILSNNGVNANLGANFTNNGTISLTCPGGGCSSGPTGGANLNVNDKDFVNAGTVTIEAASGTGAGIGANHEGTITNTGTMQFDQSAGLGGPVTNQGAINIADGKIALSNTSSCGDTGGFVKNDTGGQITSTGAGTLSAVNYEQGAGTTSGTAPITVNCGYLKYTGAGASTVRVNSGASMTGNVAAGQTLSIAGTVHTSSFTNAGTITLDQSLSNPNLNLGGTATNTGTIQTSGASANSGSVQGTIDQTGGSAQVVIPAGTKLNLANPLLLKAGKLSGGGTLQGSVNNSGGTVTPGASPGTLTLSGNYEQGAGGNLAIEVEGTGAGQFDRLVVGGNATLAGALALQPTPGFVAAAAPGDSVDFLTYGGTRTGEFASTGSNPPPECADAFSVAYDDGAKKASFVVANSGAMCVKPETETPKTTPATPAAPDTVLNSKPKAKVKIKKGKAKVKFTFTSTVTPATFECKLDQGTFASCTSPRSYKVKPGRHTFSVRAIAGGVTDPTPASFSFKVVKKKKRR